MEIFTSKSAISQYLSGHKQQNKSIGFVPTMGALHKGHISLLEIAASFTDVTVCSIFVNPTQFTDANDLEKYPRPIEADIDLLKKTKCSALFLPSVEEMYSEGESWKIDLGYLENILEGKFRPGHYHGVTQIVKKLLDVVAPDYMFLGQKDFQQVMVIERMINELNFPVEIVMCPIVREDDGLALSSRNIHLTAEERKLAVYLSQLLYKSKLEFGQKSLKLLQQEAWNTLMMIEGVSPEYFEICNAKTLLPIQGDDAESIVALVAAKIGNIRLIDNIILK